MIESTKHYTKDGHLYEIVLEPVIGRTRETIAYHAMVLLGKHYYVGKAGVGVDANSIDDVREILLSKAHVLAEDIVERKRSAYPNNIYKSLLELSPGTISADDWK